MNLSSPSSLDVFSPAAKRLKIDLSSDVLNPKSSIAETVRETLKVNGYLHTDLPDRMLPRLTDLLSQPAHQVSLVLHDRELIGILAPGGPLLGLAVDLGTMVLAAYLVDLENGQPLASASLTNPQILYGSSIIERLRYEETHPQGAADLKAAVVKGINQLAADLTSPLGLSCNEIMDGVIAGNTAMHHLLLGLPTHTLMTSPSRPSRIDALTFRADTISLNLAENASIYLPPNIAGLIGGDHIAALLSAQVRHTLKSVLLLDFGAATEISLLHKGRHLVCTCSSQNGLQANPPVRSAIKALLREADLSADELDLCLVADAFGGEIDLQEYQRRGLLPLIPLKRCHTLGNAAGLGACSMLLNISRRAEAESMPEHIEFMDLISADD